MTEVAVNEALGELLSPGQATTYLACPAKWYLTQSSRRRTTRGSQELVERGVRASNHDRGSGPKRRDSLRRR
jgi:hypothetical protein